jgi:hypothetical protein
MRLARVAVTRLRHYAAFVCLLATSRHSPLKPNKAGELALGQCLDAISKCSAALEHTNEIDGVTLRELHVCTHTHTSCAKSRHHSDFHGRALLSSVLGGCWPQQLMTNSERQSKIKKKWHRRRCGRGHASWPISLASLTTTVCCWTRVDHNIACRRPWTRSLC